MTKIKTMSWVRTTKLIQKTLGLCLLSTVFNGAAFAQDMSDVVVKSYHVAGQVWVLTGAGGNVTVQIGDEGVL